MIVLFYCSLLATVGYFIGSLYRGISLIKIEYFLEAIYKKHIKNNKYISFINTYIFPLLSVVIFFYSYYDLFIWLHVHFGPLPILLLCFICDYYFSLNIITVIINLKKMKDFFTRIKKYLTTISIVLLLLSQIKTNSLCTAELAVLGFFIFSFLLYIYLNYYANYLKNEYPYLYKFLVFIAKMMLMISTSFVFMLPFGPRTPYGSGNSGFGGSSGGPQPGGQPPGGPNMPKPPQGLRKEREGYIWIYYQPAFRSLESYIRYGDEPRAGILVPVNDPQGINCMPTRPHNVSPWGPEGRRPATPDWTPSRAPWRTHVNITDPNASSNPSPSHIWRKHWEGPVIRTPYKPIQGDTYRWIDDPMEWVPTRWGQNRFVHRDFHFKDGKWVWRVGEFSSDQNGISIGYDYHS
jgi:hypothetical protein